MAQDFMGPPEALPSQTAFSRLASAGTQAPAPHPPTVFRPFVGQIPNIQGDMKRAAALQPIGAASDAVFDEYIANGMDVEKARALTMLQTARRLDELGFRQEASQMRQAGADNLKAWRDTVLSREETMADIANTRSTTNERDEELEAASETWIKLDPKSGQMQDFRQVFVTDDDEMRALKKAGWIALTGSMSGILSATLDDFATGTTPPPVEILETLVAAGRMHENLDILESVVDQAGLIEGPFRAALANRGISAFGNENFLDAVAVGRQMRADVQSLVKGIPSNYDAEIFELTVPDPTRFAGSPIYQAQINLMRRNVNDLVRLTVSYYNGTERALAPGVVEWAKRFGIDPASVAPMNAADVQRVEQDKGKSFDAQDNPFAEHARNMERELGHTGVGSTQTRQDILGKIP